MGLSLTNWTVIHNPHDHTPLASGNQRNNHPVTGSQVGLPALVELGNEKVYPPPDFEYLQLSRRTYPPVKPP